MVKPGDDFIDVPLPANFDEQFAKSLQFPIEVCENDTPEKVKLKQDVIEARKVLEEAANRGESPRQLLIEAAKTFRRMMEIKNTYQRLVYEQIDAGASDQEINDLVRAATQLLEKEGMESKISLPYKTRLRIENGKSKGLIKD